MRMISYFFLLLFLVACSSRTEDAGSFNPSFVFDASRIPSAPKNPFPCTNSSSFAFNLALGQTYSLVDRPQLSGSLIFDESPAYQAIRNQDAIAQASIGEPIEQVRFDIANVDSCTVSASFELPFSETREFKLHDSHLKKLTPGSYVLIAYPKDSREVLSARGFEVRRSEPLCADPKVGNFKKSIRFKLDDRRSEVLRFDTPSVLCIDIKAGGNQTLKELVINGHTIVDSGVYPARFSGAGGNQFTRTHAARTHIIQVAGSAGLELDIRAVDAPQNIGPLDQRWRCDGSLKGFIDHGIHTTRRKIPRENITVRCSARFLVFDEDDEGSNARLVELNTFAITNKKGEYSSFFTPEMFASRGIQQGDVLISVETACQDPTQCGIDALPIQAAEQPLLDEEPNVSRRFTGNIDDVVDIASAGLVARLVTADPNPYRQYRPPGSSVATTGNSSASNTKPNDLPLIIHEAFDPLREDGTDYLFWLLNGQYVDFHRRGKNEIVDSPCEAPIEGPCLPCTLFMSDCNPEENDVAQCRANVDAGVEGFRPSSPNLSVKILENLANQGYDVWLVDSILPDGTVFEIARRSPAIYQKVLDFPQRDFSQSVLIRESRFFGRPREIAVGGVSAGGVVARVALRLWELADQIGVDPDADPQFRLFPTRGTTDRPDRVAMYLSLESPHNGAILPPTLQAYITDPKFGASGADAQRLRNLLQSNSLAELTANFVPEQRTPCWNSDKEPQFCFFGERLIDPPPNAGPDGAPTPSQEDFGDSAFDQLQFTLRKSLDSYEPDSMVGDGGFPSSMPMIAVSNGSVLRDPITSDGKLARLSVSGHVWVFTPFPIRLGIDRQNHLFANIPQPRGSGLPQLCELTKGEGSANSTDFFGFVFPGIVRAKVDVRIDMHPGDSGDNVFPTFIPTESALAINSLANSERRRLRHIWDDAQAADDNLPHFAISERNCEFLMYHLDGHMKGDRDGYPKCTGEERSCSTGSRRPGFVLNRRSDESSAFCDPDDSKRSIIPWVVTWNDWLDQFELPSGVNRLSN